MAVVAVKKKPFFHVLPQRSSTTTRFVRELVPIERSAENDRAFLATRFSGQADLGTLCGMAVTA